MRELMFRTWNGKSMVYGGFSIHATGKFISSKDERVLSGIKGEPPIMQYTGLKDKNDKMIFEGDLWGRDGYIGEVVWEFAGWGFQRCDNSKSFQYPSFYSNADSGEIIGNIYEED